MGVPCGQKRQYQGSDKAETAQEVCRGNQLWFSKWKSAITRLTVSQWFTWRYLRELASPQSRQLKLPIRMSYSSSIMKKRQWNLIPLVVLNTLKFEKHCGILLILRTTGVSEEIVSCVLDFGRTPQWFVGYILVRDLQSSAKILRGWHQFVSGKQFEHDQARDLIDGSGPGTKSQFTAQAYAVWKAIKQTFRKRLFKGISNITESSKNWK